MRNTWEVFCLIGYYNVCTFTARMFFQIQRLPESKVRFGIAKNIKLISTFPDHIFVANSSLNNY